MIPTAQPERAVGGVVGGLDGLLVHEGETVTIFLTPTRHSTLSRGGLAPGTDIRIFKYSP